MESLSAYIQQAIGQGRALNRRERLLELPVQNYSQLEEMLSKSEHLVTLWRIANGFQENKQEWLQGALLKQSYTEIAKMMEFYYREV